MFGNAVQAENCGEWTPWGPCIWLKSGGGGGRSARWDRPYFEQLLPGRTGCRHHVFFKLLRDKWGEAFNNFYQYLRDITLSDKQCGECSYQQSCGRNCYKRGSIDKMNPLFVAERLCPNVDQSDACVSRRVNADCRLWPTPAHVQLPNVTEAMRDVIAGIDYLSCVPEQRDFGDVVCRCCCHPFAPNPANGYKCELKPYLRTEFEKIKGLQTAGMTPLDISSMYSIKGIAILDQEGNRVLSKYYDADLFSTEEDRLSFEKMLFQKTYKANSEILLLNGLVCVYRSNVDLFFYVIGDCAENELVLLNMLNSVYDSFSTLLKKNVERKMVLDNLDNALLIFDELCDDGVIFGDGVARNCPAASA